MPRIEFTHAGLFGLCPVHLADIDGDAPVVHPRHVLLAPLFWLSEALFGALFMCAAVMAPEWEPVWPLTRVRELERPLVREFPDEADAA